MKAKTFTGEIIEITQVGTGTHLFNLKDVEFINAPEDYWTRLEHQYAGMAMQGMLSNPSITERKATTRNGIIEDAERLAHVLVEKLKEER